MLYFGIKVQRIWLLQKVYIKDCPTGNFFVQICVNVSNASVYFPKNLLYVSFFSPVDNKALNVYLCKLWLEGEKMLIEMTGATKITKYWQWEMQLTFFKGKEKRYVFRLLWCEIILYYSCSYFDIVIAFTFVLRGRYCILCLKLFSLYRLKISGELFFVMLRGYHTERRMFVNVANFGFR